MSALLETVVNVTSLLGWGLALLAVTSMIAKEIDVKLPASADGVMAGVTRESLLRPVLGLELLCCVEVLRMLVGSLRGNWVLGIGLHYTRLFVLLAVLPALIETPIFLAVLWAWSLTEVCRYYFFVTRGGLAETLRNLVPVFTFPLGAGGEAYACWLLLKSRGHVINSDLIKDLATGDQRALASFSAFAPLDVACLVQLIGNIVIGIVAYPGFLKKGLGGKNNKKKGSKKKGD